MKITGAEFNEWFKNHWPGPDWYLDDFDDDLFDDEGLIDESATYDTDSLGAVYWQGAKDTQKTFFDVEIMIKRWRKERDEFTLVVSGPKAKKDDVCAALKGLGCKVK